MNNEERVLNIIHREPVDYLPSHIVFSDRTRISELERAVGIEPGTFDEYADNHLKFTYSRFDLPLHFRNDDNLMCETEKQGFCKIDREKHIVYDDWGMGIVQYTDGFTPVFHPMQGKNVKRAALFMPNRLPENFLQMDEEELIHHYSAPDTNKAGAYDDITEAIQKNQNGEYLVVPAGYWGTWERSYGLRGFEEFMVDLASEPKLAEELLEKVTEFKINDAKKKIAAGVKIGHHGDDLGTQLMTFFSKDMFKRLILPYLRRLFDVYKSANIPMAMHSCGNITEFIPFLIDIGLDLLEPVQPCMDLAFLKREFGNHLTFWGGIDTQELLPYGTPDKVREQTREVIRTLGKGGGYIIGPSQEIMSDVPVANIVAMIEVIKEERARVL